MGGLVVVLLVLCFDCIWRVVYWLVGLFFRVEVEFWGWRVFSNNWLFLMFLVCGLRCDWIRLVWSGWEKGRRVKRWVVFDVDGGGV